MPSFAKTKFVPVANAELPCRFESAQKKIRLYAPAAPNSRSAQTAPLGGMSNEKVDTEPSWVASTFPRIRGQYKCVKVIKRFKETNRIATMISKTYANVAE